MDSVIRGAVTYFGIWVLFRVAGKRTLAELTSFDLVLLLIISEAAQAALIDSNNSITNSFLVIVTLLGIDVALSVWKQWSPRADKLIDGVPLIILADGIPLTERLTKSRVDESDILAAARQLHGLERLEQIKYAVLERSGDITVVPKEQAA